MAPEAVRKELDRVLASSGFSRNERLSRFLRFIVERHLEGRDSDLKESVIAIEVFGRKPDYDPKQDSIVRSEAARLRSRLVEYFVGEGSRDSIVIELPKGGYVPAIRSTQSHPAVPSQPWRRPALWGAALAVSLAIITTVLWWLPLHKPPVTVAVLPLKNLGHNPEND
jgi:hypothetical protein